jgi:hypothetical protein
MRATSWRLGVLLLLAAPVTEASGQPAPAPADRAAAPTQAEQKFLAKARLLSAEGSRAYQRADLRRAIRLFQEALENCRKAYPRESCGMCRRPNDGLRRSLTNGGISEKSSTGAQNRAATPLGTREETWRAEWDRLSPSPEVER